jgi:hypothetical protein
VNVQVEDGLSGACTNVEDGTVAILDFSLACDLGGCQMAAANDLRVGTFRFFQSSKMPFGDHEDMCRRLRPYVFEGKDVFIFEHLFGRDFAPNNAAEETVGIQHHPKTIALPREVCQRRAISLIAQ